MLESYACLKIYRLDSLWNLACYSRRMQHKSNCRVSAPTIGRLLEISQKMWGKGSRVTFRYQIESDTIRNEFLGTRLVQYHYGGI